MADVKKTVELEIIAESDSVGRELDKVAKQTATLGETNTKFGKIAAKHQKEHLKLDKKLTDPKKQKKSTDGLKEANKLEKKRLDLLKAQRKELEKMAQAQAALAPPPTTPTTPGETKPSGGGDGPAGGNASLIAGIGTALGAAVVSLAGMVVGTVSSQISAGFDQYVDYGKALTGLMGTGATETAGDELRHKGIKQGYTATETIQQAATVARGTGQYDAVTQAQQVTRGTALDMPEVTGFMQQQTQAGQGFGGAAGAAGSKGFKQMSKAIALGTSAGIEEARLGEYMAGVQKVVQMQAGRQGGDIDTFEYAKVLQAMGQFGGSGLQGARGGAVLSQLNEAIVKPGGGEAGQALMMQAMGFGTPSGGATYYEARKQQQEGATSKNVKAMFSQVESQSGGTEETILKMEEMTGLGITQLEKMYDVYKKMDDPKRDEKLQKIIDDSGSVEDKSLAEMKKLGKVATQAADFQNRLVDLGAESYESIIKMQIAINKMVDELLPAAIIVLEKVATAAHHIARVMGGNIFGLGDADGDDAKRRSKVGLGVGEFDPANIPGTGNLSMEKRKAIASVLQDRKEAGSPVDKWFESMTSSGPGSWSPEEQRAMFEATFGPNGTLSALLDEKLTGMVKAANKVAAETAEAIRARNGGPADSSAAPSETDAPYGIARD